MDVIKQEFNTTKASIRERDDKISQYQKRLQSITVVDKNVSALAASLSTEIERRTRAIQSTADLQTLLQDMVAAQQDLKKSNEELVLAREHQTQQIAAMERESTTWNHKLGSLEFELDEMRVAALSAEKKYRELAQEVSQAQDVVARAKQAETAKGEENKLLQGKVTTLTNKNRELSEQIQTFSSRYEDQQKVIAKMNVELQEARQAAQLSIRQNHFTQDEVKVLQGTRTELLGRIKSLEDTIREKEGEIFEMGLKQRDQKDDYERKLAEERIKLAKSLEQQSVLEQQHRQAEEEREKQLHDKQATSAAEQQQHQLELAAEQVKIVHDTNGSVGIDPEMLAEMEKRWAAREALLQADVKTYKQALMDKEDLVATMKAKIATLSKHTVDIRSEKLKTVERDLRARLEEFLMMEEALETACMCPLTLERFEHPMILVPCGHTFSKTPLDERKAESFDGIKCYACEKKAAKAIKNEAVERIVLEMDRRKNFVLAMSNFMAVISGTI
ncbi:hypothetical protein SmJEL517_g02858 [Synchytrium microbalum]|uniref:Zinc finger RING-type eukaryotic domain-containing protein n=1 Tax=Synchytrium microbalum TaxID=1806994 RepID=A0A507BZ88_9FUNG|nr:uncharacterized protein SmJEL517_g02858 [Synchytrium microbalum]TPX34590.1 hypothetical protein SmJEL517_g02858 [Synchytrium microbalum]